MVYVAVCKLSNVQHVPWLEEKYRLFEYIRLMRTSRSSHLSFHADLRRSRRCLTKEASLVLEASMAAESVGVVGSGVGSWCRWLKAAGLLQMMRWTVRDFEYSGIFDEILFHCNFFFEWIWNIDLGFENWKKKFRKDNIWRGLNTRALIPKWCKTTWIAITFKS